MLWGGFVLDLHLRSRRAAKKDRPLLQADGPLGMVGLLVILAANYVKKHGKDMGKLYWNRFCENVWEGRRFFQWCVGGWNPNHTLPEFCCQDDDFGAPKAHEFDRCNLDVLPLSWCSTWRCLIAMSLARGWQQLRIFGILQIPNFCRTWYLIGCQSESLDLSRSLTKPGNG